ncbi:F0F1 ATP synthase subunit epsilon [Pelotomaculum sp. PtaB.Bin117]|uniref:F0F1 ATP synthase subunit epsilon n=1 Tax=Pelotomaculum sp. PtaB.Bin117 TaxID=1811694 RepID=UPI0009CBB999|nr:F0F1 ATP synthase subunit epsilon [Pelotomaculum sp. PtaB.Bin117]OPX91279.1 MAG: ATP synthase epsilon chain [Pelotomaculum sp. PtaB.Bin117]
MSEKTQRLDIVTPVKKIFSEDIRFFVAPGSEGELGILPDHAALITALKIGVLRIEQEGKKFNIAVSGGFLEVRNSKATILATAAERAEDIDVDRAEAAKQRAEQRLAAKMPDLDVLRAELALKRAVNRLKAAGR